MLFPFVGDDVGGSHVSALGLFDALDREAFDPVIALHQTDGPLADMLRERGTPFVPAPDVMVLTPRARSGLAPRGAAAARYPFATLPRLRSWLRAGRFDVLHTNDGRVHATWGPAALGSATRHVWHHRGDPSARGANVLAPLVADRIVTVSRFAKPERPVRLIDGRWSMVHSPFAHPGPPDRAAARAGLAREVGAAPGEALVGYFGNLIARKRPEAMADIVAALASREGVRTHAVLFGGPVPGDDHAAAIERRARALGVADRVHRMGHRAPVEEWMSGVDVLAVPALGEPFGRTLIEAMMLGTPVVATRHGGNVEAIEHGHNGYLVEPGDPAAFAAPIARLMADPEERDRIARVARREALARYGVENHARAIERIYRDLVAGSGTAGGWKPIVSRRQPA